AGLLARLLLVERQKLPIPLRPPREAVNAIKTEHVVDAKEVEHLAHVVNAPPPPRKVIAPHRVPSIKRHAPVLPPFLREEIVLEIRLGRRAAAPFQIEQLR